MATFFEELWESIFTPGPTRSLLVATNVTFACLQLVLLVLLLATYNIHALMLSIICAGLWWAINWFAAELHASQVREEQEKARAADRPARQTGEDSDTEVEGIDTLSKSAMGSNEVELLDPVGELTHRLDRPESSQGTKSGVSTEDEWEKVSEHENEKDK